MPDLATTSGAERAPLQICTIVAQNYLPFVRVLASSVRAHGGRLSVFLVDDEEATSGGEESFDLLTRDDLGIDPVEYRRMAAIYDITEFATAVKPWVLSALLARGSDSAVYLDPDIAVLSPLDELDELIATEGIVLTPHAPHGFPRDGRFPEERSILAAGIYNLGFVAVGQQAMPFLEWWKERLRRHCVNDVTDMHFVDQRWVDFVPGMFDHAILRHEGYNVAYWNLHGRTLKAGDDGYAVDGSPLRFFHFSGYSPDAPHLLSKHQLGRPRVLLSDSAVLRELCDWYRQQLLASGWAGRATSYGWAALADGTPLDARMRRLYRTALLDAETDGTPEPPSPFAEDGGAAFRAWMREPVHPPLRPIVSRYLKDVWQEIPAFRTSSPTLLREGAYRFLEWLRVHGDTTDLPQAMLPDPADVDRSLPPLEPVPGRGFVVLQPERGALPRPSGWTAISPGGQRCELIRFNRGMDACDGTPNYLASDVTILQTLPVEGMHLALVDDLDLFSTRRIAGLWHWSIDGFSPDLHNAFAPLDEVWVPSSFSLRAVASRALRPIRLFTLPVARVAPRVGDPDFEGAATTFVCPIELGPEIDALEASGGTSTVEAYRAAFEPGDGAKLVVAVQGIDHSVALETLRDAAFDRPDIVVRPVEEDELLSLVATGDATVSLHRSTAFSMPLATAMACGKAVIATGYGGNTDYMTAENAFLVPIRLAPRPRHAGSRWAQPDLTAATRMLRTVATGAPEVHGRAAQAQADLAERHSVLQAMASLKERLAELRAGPIRRDIAWFTRLLAPDPRTLPPH